MKMTQSTRITYDSDDHKYMYCVTTTKEETTSKVGDCKQTRRVYKDVLSPVRAGDHIRTTIGDDVLDDIIACNRCGTLYLPKYGVTIGDLVYAYKIERLN